MTAVAGSRGIGVAWRSRWPGTPAKPLMSPITVLPELTTRLRDDTSVLGLLGRRQAVLSVPEHGRGYVLAGLEALSSRSPFLVVVPTTTEAERLQRDLSTWLGSGDRVELFPAWETLPFERVSPNVETMGRRQRVIWRLRHGEAPAVVVAPVRALVQRLGPHVDDVEPVVVRPLEQRDRDDLLGALVAMGYRREDQVDHRGEVAV